MALSGVRLIPLVTILFLIIVVTYCTAEKDSAREVRHTVNAVNKAVAEQEGKKPKIGFKRLLHAIKKALRWLAFWKRKKGGQLSDAEKKQEEQLNSARRRFIPREIPKRWHKFVRPAARKMLEAPNADSNNGQDSDNGKTREIVTPDGRLLITGAAAADKSRRIELQEPLQSPQEMSEDNHLGSQAPPSVPSVQARARTRQTRERIQELCNERALFGGTPAVPRAFLGVLRKPTASLEGYCGWVTDWFVQARVFSSVLWLDIWVDQAESHQLLQLQWTTQTRPINWSEPELTVLSQAIEEVTGRSRQSAASWTVNLSCPEAKALTQLGVFLSQKVGELLQSPIPSNLQVEEDYGELRTAMDSMKEGLWRETEEDMRRTVRNYCEASVAAECL